LVIDSALFQENERTAPKNGQHLTCQVGALRCEAGGYLEQVEVAYETWGELNSDRSNAILVCHALTGDSHATGWWQALVGPKRPIDTEKYFVVCSNVLGGCQGSTGPSSKIPGTDAHYGARFPIITVGDMVRVQSRLLDHLGLDRLHCIAGGSMGGMLALEWTVQQPGRARRAFITASSASHGPMQIGFNEGARQAVMRDPKWRGGNYPLEDPPVQGLAVARMIGHLTFLSDAAFETKFGRRLQGKDVPDYHLGVEFEVESYLKHQAEKFTTRFDANSFLYLTRAIDYYRLDSLEQSESEYLFVSFTSDWIYPTHHSQTLHDMARDAGCPSRHEVVDLPYGHDAFLLDGIHQGRLLTNFLEQ
jgi:homoserine O-acetyltransferase